MDFESFISLARASSASIPDKRVFDYFVQKYYGLIRFIAKRRIDNPQDQEEKTQDILLKFHQQNLFASFRGESEIQFRAWLNRIVLNEIFTWYKKTSRLPESLFAFDGDFPQHHELAAEVDPTLKSVEKNDLDALFQGVIDELPSQLKEIIQLRLQNYTNREIGEILAKPKGTVDSLILKALDIMRNNLKKKQVNLE